MAGSAEPLIGVLALQGGFEAHERMLAKLGPKPPRTREVRVPPDLEGLDGLVVPGGESTTMTLGIAREGLAEPLRELAARGTPIMGSCAGLIMLDRDHLGVMDMRAERNAFGRQIRSFEADVAIAGMGIPPAPPIRGIFIRAPWIAEHGPDVEILGEVDGHGVAARQGRTLAVAFHAELGDDDRLHRLFLDWVREASASGHQRAIASGVGEGR
ncbi:MAG TPA: pyridoxal 5'-phosphate synthase glutaminase subunit PdxT [Solirubrobacteraceae bacterium]